MKKRINKEPMSHTKTEHGNPKKINISIAPSMVVLASYILLLLSKFIDITLLNRDNEYLSIIILQIMIFILPSALWCVFCGEKYVKHLRLVPIKIDAIVLIIAASLAMISGGILLSILFGGVGSFSESFTLYDTFISKYDGSVGDALYLVLAFAALPALCEEFMFRGILCYEHENKGTFFAIAVNTIFFSLLHFSIFNIPTFIFCGILLSLLLYASRSLIAPIIVHFLYNIFGLFGYPFISNLYLMTGNSRLIIFLAGTALLLSLALFFGEASRLYRKYLRNGVKSWYKKSNNIFSAFIELIKDPYVIASVAVYIVAVFISLLLGG